MKKYLLYILILTMSSSLFSCEDDLEIMSEASLSATAPLAEEDVNKLLTGLYQRMMEPSGYAYFNILAPGLLADNFKPVKFQWFQVQYMYEHKVPADDILLSYQYKDYYTGISRANTIITVPTATEDQIGKAKFCRALNYMRLYDLYERVPLVDETYDNTEIAPSSKQDVLNFIIADLIDAQAKMNPMDLTDVATNQTVPTKEAATALLARMYRLNGELAKAGEQAESLIKAGNFTLAANPLERTNEVIMRFAGNKAEENGSWGWIMSPAAKTWNCFAAADDLVALLDADDTRRILFDIEGKDANEGYVYSKKYRTNDDSDLLISRIAEMYLISAEAGNANRLTELQAVRKSSLSLENERRLEMSFEWTRWQDLKLAGETYRFPYPQGAVDANPLLK
ncbi:RagB/SusD family nutrient uptake outer membrane protein [Marinifilum fragile]|uniref:RagB/SusD family nutrient uptake outer membrane protein n=1 Tax=Marinifilum fragile TaxID=570161 RepID=UPI002AAB213F|nr:RagB/SusD family nutrient uptake outer membrane protein [Marinifilum fragile]